MDVTETLAPSGDQLDAIELIGTPRTFQITGVTKGSAEQPVDISLADFPRAWRPGKSMRRVLAACWGTDASVWVGRFVTLYCDETVRFGSEVVGGTRISALSDIDGTRKIPLIIKRGKSAVFTVEPLTEAATRRVSRGQVPASTTEPTREQIAACTDLDELRTMWHASGAERKAQIEARNAELDTTAPVEGGEA